MVSPPGRFSTTMGCFQSLVSESAIVRAAASGDPMPGAKGVVIRTVRSGQASAAAGSLTRPKVARAALATNKNNKFRFIAASLEEPFRKYSAAAGQKLCAD